MRPFQQHPPLPMMIAFTYLYQTRNFQTSFLSHLHLPPQQPQPLFLELEQHLDQNSTEKDALAQTSVTPLKELQQVTYVAETHGLLDNGPPKKNILESVFPKGLKAVLAKYPDGQLLLQNREKLIEERHSSSRVSTQTSYIGIYIFIYCF